MSGNINTKGSLILVGKELRSGRIVAYYVVNPHGVEHRVRREQFMRMVREDKVINVKASGEYMTGLYIPLTNIIEIDTKTGRVSDGIPKEKVVEMVRAQCDSGKYTMVARISSGKEIVGYDIVNSDGKKFRASRKDVTNLARQRRIKDVTTQMYNNEIILRGTNGFDISKLPTIKYGENTGNITGNTGKSGTQASAQQIQTDTRDRAGDLSKIQKLIEYTQRIKQHVKSRYIGVETPEELKAYDRIDSDLEAALRLINSNKSYAKDLASFMKSNATKSAHLAYKYTAHNECNDCRASLSIEVENECGNVGTAGIKKDIYSTVDKWYNQITSVKIMDKITVENAEETILRMKGKLKKLQNDYAITLQKEIQKINKSFDTGAIRLERDARIDSLVSLIDGVIENCGILRETTNEMLQRLSNEESLDVQQEMVPHFAKLSKQVNNIKADVKVCIGAKTGAQLMEAEKTVNDRIRIIGLLKQSVAINFYRQCAKFAVDRERENIKMSVIATENREMLDEALEQFDNAVKGNIIYYSGYETINEDSLQRVYDYRIGTLLPQITSKVLRDIP